MLRINLDETSICVFQGRGKGNVFLTKQQRLRVCRRVTLAQRRTNYSHVGIACDDVEIQARLPQTLVGNCHTLPDGLGLAALRASLPANVFLERERSSWVNAGMMGRIVRRLAAALRPFMAERQPILLLDAHGAHIAAAVFDELRTAGIWVVIIPANMTWLLQPLDTHCFAQFKAFLRKACKVARVRSAIGEVGLAGFLRCVCDAIRSILEGRSWAHAFDNNGFGLAQIALSERVKAQLPWGQIAPAPSTKPSMAQLQCIFPRRAPIPWTIWPPPVVRALPLGPRLRRGLAGRG